MEQHLVFGVDKWFATPLLGQATFHSIGLANTVARNFGWLGLDLDPTSCRRFGPVERGYDCARALCQGTSPGHGR